MSVTDRPTVPAEACPSCGHCPTCGHATRGAPQPAPPYTVTTGSDSTATVGASITIQADGPVINEAQLRDLVRVELRRAWARDRFGRVRT